LTEHASWRWCKSLDRNAPHMKCDLTENRLLHQSPHWGRRSCALRSHHSPRACEERAFLHGSRTQSPSRARSRRFLIVRPTSYNVSSCAAVWLWKYLRMEQRYHHRIIRRRCSLGNHFYTLGAAYGRSSHASGQLDQATQGLGKLHLRSG
jgi:hypothetical protein